MFLSVTGVIIAAAVGVVMSFSRCQGDRMHNASFCGLFFVLYFCQSAACTSAGISDYGNPVFSWKIVTLISVISVAIKQNLGRQK